MDSRDRQRIFEEEHERQRARRSYDNAREREIENHAHDIIRVEQVGRWGVFVSVFYVWFCATTILVGLFATYMFFTGDYASLMERFVEFGKSSMAGMLLGAFIGAIRGFIKSQV